MKQRKMYNIADCSVTMNCTTPFMLRQCGRYEVQGEATPDLDLCLTQEQLVQALLQEYEVSQEKAQESVEQFLGELQSNGFVQ